MGEQVKVRLDGRAMVRPAQPTPTRHFFLPSLDIFWRDIHYNQRLLFYESAPLSGAAALMQQLRRSLALCLVHYYPWCGRVAKDSLPPHRVFIDCNDAGVEFVEAAADRPLSSLARSGRFQMNPFFLQLCQRPDHKEDALYRSPLLSIQATLFSDGGLTLGIAQSHIVADGQSLWNFMVSWGECSRGVSLSLPPLHNRERLAVPHVSLEKAKWSLYVDVEETEASASDKDSGLDTRALSGDETSSSTGTFSATSDKLDSNASSNTSSVVKLACTEIALQGDVPTHNVGDGSSANEGQEIRKGEEPVTQGRKKNRLDENGNSETMPPKGGEKANSCSNGDKESKGGTAASVGDKSSVVDKPDPDPDPLVQCLFDLPSLAIKELKRQAGAGFTSYEVVCAHFWQRMTIARQSPLCDPTYFSALINGRTRLTPPLPSTYFGNVITFSLAESTVAKIGSESLHDTASRIHTIVSQTQEDRFVSFMHWLESNNNRLVFESGTILKGKGINVASSPRFPAYGVDFGWGTPVAVRPVKAGREGELVLFGGRPGSLQGDMEICTALPDSVLRRLLEDPGFLAKPPGSPFTGE